MPVQDVVIAWPSVVHRIGAFEARGGTKCHIATGGGDEKNKNQAAIPAWKRVKASLLFCHLEFCPG